MEEYEAEVHSEESGRKLRGEEEDGEGELSGHLRPEIGLVASTGEQRRIGFGGFLFSGVLCLKNCLEVVPRDSCTPGLKSFCGVCCMPRIHGSDKIAMH